MKRIISLLLVIIMLCSMMASCDNALMLEAVPYFYYTVDESLTDHDIEFLKMKPKMYVRNDSSDRNSNGCFSGKVSQVTVGNVLNWHFEYDDGIGKMFWIQNDIDNGYYLCLYSDQSFWVSILTYFDSLFRTDYSSKYHTWYRLDGYNYEDIPKERDGKKLEDVFFLCDSVIKQDLISGEKYDVEFTFYYNAGVDSYFRGRPWVRLDVREDMITIRSSKITDKHLDKSEYLFLTTWVYEKESGSAGEEWLYTDNNGVTYAIFYAYHGEYEDGKAIVHDGELELSVCKYEAVLPYFEVLEIPGDEGDYQIIGVRLDTYMEILLNEDIK